MMSWAGSLDTSPVQGPIHISLHWLTFQYWTGVFILFTNISCIVWKNRYNYRLFIAHITNKYYHEQRLATSYTRNIGKKPSSLFFNGPQEYVFKINSVNFTARISASEQATSMQFTHVLLLLLNYFKNVYTQLINSMGVHP